MPVAGLPTGRSPVSEDNSRSTSDARTPSTSAPGLLNDRKVVTNLSQKCGAEDLTNPDKILRLRGDLTLDKIDFKRHRQQSAVSRKIYTRLNVGRIDI